MGAIFGLFALMLSLLAVVLAGAALWRVNMRTVEDARARVTHARNLHQAIARTEDHRDRMARRKTFGPDELAPPERVAPTTEDPAYMGYPSAKSIEIAKELDRRRQEARQLAREQGLAEPAVSQPDGEARSFVPSSTGRDVA